MDKEKYVGNSKIKEKPKKSLTLLLRDKIIKNKHLGDKEISWEKLSNGVVNKILQMISNAAANLQNQIDSITIHGMAVSNQFGNDPYIGISQDALTKAFDKVWSKIEDITGEPLRGIVMSVTPTYYIGEDGCTVHIEASSVESIGEFEEIWFYWNNEEVPFAGSSEPITHFEYDAEIDDTTYIRCRARIMGRWYEKQSKVTHYSSFWMGAGNSYQAVMVNANLRSVSNGMRGNYDINVTNGERIIIVLGSSLREEFIRADMNGVEIAFTESAVTIDGVAYKVFTSENTYQSGIYNIDING